MCTYALHLNQSKIVDDVVEVVVVVVVVAEVVAVAVSDVVADGPQDDLSSPHRSVKLASPQYLPTKTRFS